MVENYASNFPDSSFDESVAAFIAGTVPNMLQPLIARVRTMHPAIRRFGVLFKSADGLSLRRWADSDGNVMCCPDGAAPLADNPTLSHVSTTREAQSHKLLADPALQWACGSETRPLVACPIERGNQVTAFLIIESLSPFQISGAALRELTGWAPVLAALLHEAMKTVHTLVGTILVAHDFTLLRDRDTGQHQHRISSYLTILAREMSKAHGLPEGFSDELAVFGSLHDIGKIGIADAILRKPGRFEAHEWETMKEHVTIGHNLVERMKRDLHLADTPGLPTLEAVVSCHHEYLDGSGYPAGRRGDEIPLVARLVTVADIFDALTCIRPYKRPWSITEAFEHVDKLAGSKLDSECVAALHSAEREIVAVLHSHAQADAQANAHTAQRATTPSTAPQA